MKRRAAPEAEQRRRGQSGVLQACRVGRLLERARSEREQERPSSAGRPVSSLAPPAWQEPPGRRAGACRRQEPWRPPAPWSFEDGLPPRHTPVTSPANARTCRPCLARRCLRVVRLLCLLVVVHAVVGFLAIDEGGRALMVHGRQVGQV
eukprot:763937-Hanusia_phi.AAC.2